MRRRVASDRAAVSAEPGTGRQTARPAEDKKRNLVVGLSQRINPPDRERLRQIIRPAGLQETKFGSLELRAPYGPDPGQALRKRLEPPQHRPTFGAGHPRHVPDTWPALLSRDQLCAYIGVGAETITRICPVRPLDLGANLVRYSRQQVDEWVATLPPRLMMSRRAQGDTEEVPVVVEETSETRAEAALDRVRARAGGTKWRTSG